MTNRYLEKVAEQLSLEKTAGMQRIFFKPNTTSGIAAKSLTPDITRVTRPVKSVMETNARDLVKSAGFFGEAAKSITSTIGSGVRNTGRVIAGTGSLASKGLATLGGKGRNEAAYLSFARKNPHATNEEIHKFVDQSDDEIRDYLKVHDPVGLDHFNSAVNVRKASRALVVGGLGVAALGKYNQGQSGGYDYSSYSQPQYSTQY